MPELALATFNTHMGLDVSGCPLDITGVCSRIDADVLALQECWRPGPGRGSAARAARRLGYNLYEGPFVGGPNFGSWDQVYSPDEAEATWGVTVLSRYHARRSRLVPLGRSYGDLHRAVLALDLDVDGSPLRVCATHLSVLPHGSIRDLLKLRRFRELLGPREVPAIVTGDFNMWGPVVSTLTGLRRGAIGKTWPAQCPHSQIDHVLVDGPIEIVRSEVLPAQGSDHRPVRVVVRIP